MQADIGQQPASDAAQAAQEAVASAHAALEMLRSACDSDSASAIAATPDDVLASAGAVRSAARSGQAAVDVLVAGGALELLAGRLQHGGGTCEARAHVRMAHARPWHMHCTCTLSLHWSKGTGSQQQLRSSMNTATTAQLSHASGVYVSVLELSVSLQSHVNWVAGTGCQILPLLTDLPACLSGL